MIEFLPLVLSHGMAGLGDDGGQAVRVVGSPRRFGIQFTSKRLDFELPIQPPKHGSSKAEDERYDGLCHGVAEGLDDENLESRDYENQHKP